MLNINNFYICVFAVERKRRDAINERIMHLATILPPNPDLYVLLDICLTCI